MKMWGATMLTAGVLTALGCLVPPSDSFRILAIFPLNSRSHDAMCDRLARGLAARGHQVDVYSQYPPKKPLANYRHFSLEGTLRTLTNNMNYSTAVQFQAQDPRDVIQAVGNPSCKLMELPLFQPLLTNPPKDPPYDLVIVETFIADCYLAWGRHLGVPMVGLMTSPMLDWYNEALGNPFNTAISPALGNTVFGPMNFWQRLHNTLMASFVRFLFDRAIQEQNQSIERLFGSGYPDIGQLRRDLDLVIVNSHHSLEGVRPLTASILPVAGIHIDDEDKTKLPEDIEKWLDDSEQGCVYFSFGSMVRIETFPRPVIQAFYRTFRSIAPVRVLLKIANPAELPAGLPSNVMTKSWFPQLQVLKHKNTKAFVTHGGLMSAHESIHSAVPMVGIPIFGDQHSNVEINVRKGIATSVKLDAIDEQKLTAAIKDVLHNPSYRQTMDKLSRTFVDRPMKPLDTAVYWVEYVARHGRKCLRSPLADMPWWQANLLDVYAFITSVLLLVFLALKFIVKLAYNACCSTKHLDSSSKSKSTSKKER